MENLINLIESLSLFKISILIAWVYAIIYLILLATKERKECLKAKQFYEVEKRIYENCNGKKDTNVEKVYLFLDRKDGLTDVWCDGICLGESLDTEGMNNLNLHWNE